MGEGQGEPHCSEKDERIDRSLPKSTWTNVLWTDKTKIELFGNAHQQFFFIDDEMKLIRKRTPLSMVEDP